MNTQIFRKKDTLRPNDIFKHIIIYLNLIIITLRTTCLRQKYALDLINEYIGFTPNILRCILKLLIIIFS
jgi:hypothetical protein